MLDSLAVAARRAVIRDGGPLYHEFIPEAVVKEPWNAYSSLLFFVPIFFWLWRLRGEYRNNGIIIALLPLLFLNGLGSTLYHAFRTRPFFLLLDFVPASLMSILLSTYLWSKVVKRWWVGLLIVIGFCAPQIAVMGGLFRDSVWGAIAPNVTYFMVGCSFFIPLVFILVRTRFYKWPYVLWTLVFLVLALACRSLDYPTPPLFPKVLPQGTHFLWHVFTVLAVFTMGYYVYSIHPLGRLPAPKTVDRR